jgi:DNA-binding GntR family transcriptional regulator
VARRTLADDVTNLLRKAIFHGEVRPGEHLREEHFAELFGVSRGPIREALNRLEGEFLVVKQPNRGFFVRALSIQDVEEIYPLRLALERLAVQLAIQNPQAQVFAQMQMVVDQMAQLAQGDFSLGEAAELNMNFHECLCLASGNQRLHAAWTNLRSQIYLYLVARTEVSPSFRARLHTLHQDLLDPIVARDLPRAIQLLETHFQAAYQDIIQSLRRQQACKPDQTIGG